MLSPARDEYRRLSPDPLVADWLAPIDHSAIAPPAPATMSATPVLTIRYRGDEDTRPQTVRLRAAAQRADLRLQRPTIANNGRLRASGTVSPGRVASCGCSWST